MSRRKAIVVGAGIGGLTAAIALRRAGLDVEVHERAAALRASGTGLSVLSNAVGALRSLGVEGALERRGRVLASFDVRAADGRPLAAVPLQDIGAKLGAPSVNVHRGELLTTLREAAGDCPIVLGAACESVAEDAGGVAVTFEDGRVARADLVVGADGVHSAVRRALVGAEPLRDAGYVCWLAVASFTHARLGPGGVAHYWGRGQRFGLIDVGWGRTYWWGTRNTPHPSVVGPAADKRAVLAAYDGWADEVRQAIEATPGRAILQVPARDRPFLARWGRGRVTLLGDAAHPMLTSLGQGAGMAIEDAVVLGDALRGADDVAAALRRYETRRAARTRRMVRLSRVVSRIEQLENPVAVYLRDAYFRLVGRRALFRQNEPLLTFDAAA